jgi:hypothetical protein
VILRAVGDAPSKIRSNSTVSYIAPIQQ